MSPNQRYHQYMYSYPHKCAYYDLSRDTVETALRGWTAKTFDLYLHIPFCSSKCGYCNLFSVAGADEVQKSAYAAAVSRQSEQFSSLFTENKATPGQVILGGGTPFSLSIAQFEFLFSSLEQSFHFELSAAGFDVETSPQDTTEEKLAFLKERGMRRISIGIQSFSQSELDAVYRRHSALSCHRALTWIRAIKPFCLNMDFIYGIPGQTVVSLLDSLKKALEYEPDEIFLYPLYVRKGTPLYGRAETDGDFQFVLYQAGAAFLKEHGFTQTSMRRFVKKPVSKVPCCGFEPMLSVGCGGRSYVGNLHFCEPYQVEPLACRSVLNQYIEKTDFLEGVKGYHLDEEERKRRFVIKNLGYYQGVSAAEFAGQFGLDLEEEYRPLWEVLIKEQSVCRKDGIFRLTEKGLGESDEILANWISPAVSMRMEACWRK